MRTSEVVKLSSPERFLYWIRERHNIYLLRGAGKPKPWTDDEILRSNFFTNPYRENDKVTVWFKDYLRGPWRDDPRVLFATVVFRWFGLPETLQTLVGTSLGSPGNLVARWNPEAVLRRLRVVRDRGDKIFTGAYLINSPKGRPKLEAIVDRVTAVWEDLPNVLDDLCPRRRGVRRPGHPQASIREFHERLCKRYEGLGGFYSYEIASDLRHTYFLENAPDKMTWCNYGIGCGRGLYRFYDWDWARKGDNSQGAPMPKDFLERMADILKLMQTRLSDMPPFEMREAEHCLCEWDKYERGLWGDGNIKRRFNGN